MNDDELIELIEQHGPIIDIEAWEFGSIVTFGDGFTVSYTKEELC